MLIDTHAHIADSKFNNPGAVVNKAKSNGVGYVITIGCNQSEIQKSDKIASEFENVFYTAGVYPLNNIEENQNLSDKELLNFVEKHLPDPKCVAVGECGFDFSSPPPFEKMRTPEAQSELFYSQCELAQNYKKPVIIHSREAKIQTVDFLKNNFRKTKFVWHCFTEELSIAEQLLTLENVYLSFTGLVTYPSAKYLDNVLTMWPTERLMVETDAPYLTPEPLRKQGIKPNEPSYVKIVADYIAQLKILSLDEFAATTTKNAAQFFDLPINND